MTHQDPFDLNLTRALKLTGIGCLCVLSWGVVKVANLSSATAQSLTEKVGTAIEPLNGTLLQVKGVAASLAKIDQKDTVTPHRTAIEESLDNVAGITRLAYDTEKKQQVYWGTLPQHTDDLFGKVGDVVGRLDTSADKLNLALDGVAPLLDSGKNAMDSLTKAVSDIDANLLNDPEIKELLKQALIVATQLGLTTTDLRKIADKVERDFTAPRTKKGWALEILKTIVGLGAEGADIKLYLTK